MKSTSYSYSRWLECLPRASHKLEADHAIGQWSSRFRCCITIHVAITHSLKLMFTSKHLMLL